MSEAVAVSVDMWTGWWGCTQDGVGEHDAGGVVLPRYRPATGTDPVGCAGRHLAIEPGWARWQDTAVTTDGDRG